jgi:hypothetical protein
MSMFNEKTKCEAHIELKTILPRYKGSSSNANHKFF